MAIASGVVLGPYEILTQIGSGGMGEVWRARDRRIGRDVAVKVLPEFTPGDDRVRRFEQEARAAGKRRQSRRTPIRLRPESIPPETATATLQGPIPYSLKTAGLLR